MLFSFHDCQLISRMRAWMFELFSERKFASFAIAKGSRVIITQGRLGMRKSTIIRRIYHTERLNNTSNKAAKL